MKKKTTAIVTSVASMAICASLIAGSTFALFTSESSVNMAVTTANVNVTATAGNLKQYTAKADENGTLQDENGNTYVHTETEGLAQLNGGALVVDAFKPGDKVTFDIEIRNYSTTTVKYNTAVTFGEGNSALAQALTITLGEEQVESLPYATNYKKLSKANDTENGDYVATVSVVVELPIDTVSVFTEEDHGIQGESAQIAFSVNAVQGNAKTSGGNVWKDGNLSVGDDSTLVYRLIDNYPGLDMNDLEAVAPILGYDEVEWLEEDIASYDEEYLNDYGMGYVEYCLTSPSPLSFRDGSSHTIELNGYSLTVERFINLSNGSTLTIKGGTLNYTDSNAFELTGGSGLVLEDVVLDLGMSKILSTASNVTLKNCTIRSTDCPIRLQTGTTAEIVGCTIENTNYSYDQYAMAINTGSTVTINGCTIISGGYSLHSSFNPKNWTLVEPIGGKATIKNSTVTNVGFEYTDTVTVDGEAKQVTVKKTIEKTYGAAGNVTGGICTYYDGALQS